MSDIQLDFAFILLVLATRELLLVTALGIAVCGVDDLAVDLLWLMGRRPPPLPGHVEPQRYAIFVPAWDEGAVIGAMLHRLCTTLDHPDWRVFVGVYPNDVGTRDAVLAIADPRVTMVLVSRPGPTTKADCLNHLWRAMLAAEATGDRFTAVVLHDAEDVVHPAELRLFDRALATADLVQTPVLPLPDASSRWIGGHYLDEFAESHAKEMMLRSRHGAAVPSAGVGTAFRADLLAKLATVNGVPFDASSLTEDYEIGHRAHALGAKSLFVRAREAGELIQTREFFPATVESAVRQKSRWLMGIALAGWDRLGWRGGLLDRWMLLRDRKGLLTAALSLMAYILAALLILLWSLAALLPGTMARLPDGPLGAVLQALLLFNLVLLAWRLLLRAAFTTHAAGFVEGLRSIPRAIVGNAINALAAARALRCYAALEGKQPVWEKTAHRFPSP